MSQLLTKGQLTLPSYPPPLQACWDGNRAPPLLTASLLPPSLLQNLQSPLVASPILAHQQGVGPCKTLKLSARQLNGEGLQTEAQQPALHYQGAQSDP